MRLNPFRRSKPVPVLADQPEPGALDLSTHVEVPEPPPPVISAFVRGLVHSFKESPQDWTVHGSPDRAYTHRQTGLDVTRVHGGYYPSGYYTNGWGYAPRIRGVELTADEASLIQATLSHWDAWLAKQELEIDLAEAAPRIAHFEALAPAP